MSKDTSGPAFPATEAHGLNNGLPGMTLRQWYAGLAMQGLIAQSSGTALGSPVGAGAAYAFAMADAMIVEGNK